MNLTKFLIAAFAFAVALLYGSPEVCAQSDSKFYVSATGGLSGALSGFPGNYDKGDPTVGGDWGVNLGWISRAKIGAGLSYSGYTSTAGQTVSYSLEGYHGELDIDLRYFIHYVAPQFIFQTDLGQSGWSFNASAGAGAMIFTEKASSTESGVTVSASESKSAFAWNVYAGFGYAFNSHISAIANFGYTHGNIKIVTEGYLVRYRSDFVNRINFDLGLKYTF